MRFVRFACLALLTALPRAAWAQPAPVSASNGAGFDAHLFRPALDSRGLFSVNGVDVLRGGRLSLGLVLDYGRGLLRVPDVGQPTPLLVSDSFTGTFALNYGIANRAAIGISAPVVMLSGDAQVTSAGSPAVVGWGTQALDAQAIGHVALHGKVNVTRTSSGLGLAVAAQVGVPVSDAPRSGGAEPSFWYWPMLVAERRFGSEGKLRVALNAGYRGHEASSTSLDLRDGRFADGSRLTYGAGASYRVLDPMDAVVETYGSYLLSDADPAIKPSNEALAGIKLFVEESSFFMAGAGPRYTRGFEAADLRAVVGFVFEPPIGDRDGDGVPDDVDRCPTIAGEPSRHASKNGCPLDSDEDGVPDVEDACPLVKGRRTRDPSTNGCPERSPTPPVADRDQDGVPDAEDACPNDKGERHPDPKRNGCPDVVVGPDVLTVFDKILFRTASAEILPQSEPILDKVAKALRDHAELTLIEVAGHADERGGEEMNLALTQARVESVVAALVARRVDRARLRAKGYGFYCPVDEGHDEEAWKKNRRVEFLIVETATGPTGVPLGCANASAHGVQPQGRP